MYLQLADQRLRLDVPVVMGILNVTPDSFSDGGRHPTPARALERARRMVEEGARIVDVGGESTRPGAAPVSEPEELERVIPVVERIAREVDCVISVDSTKPAVMDAACAAGARIINDVNALRSEGALAVALRRRAAVCLMHMQGEPRSMQRAPHYHDVRAEVRRFLAGRAQVCIAAGVPREALVLDPGFGFGKSLEHNLALLSHLDDYADEGLPLLVGVSRKSMLGTLTGAPVEERLYGGLAALALAVWQGAHIIRVHDVRPSVEALRVAQALREARAGAR